MKFILILITLLTISSCGSSSSKSKEVVPKYDFTYMHPLDGRDAFLVVGDSISMGYTPYLVGLFPDLQVIHNTNNAHHSREGKDNIDAWISHAGNWKVCIFNHGLHDVRPYNNVSIQDYEANLAYEANALLNACDKVMFINTTWVPSNMPTDKYPTGAGVTYNQAAETVMENLNIPVCDLYSKSLLIKNLYREANEMTDVHFLPGGYKVLANKIKECINTL